MKKLFIVFLVVFVALVAYRRMYPVSVNPELDRVNEIIDDYADSGPSSRSSRSSKSSVAPPSQGAHTVTLVDQAFDKNLRGQEWLRGIGTKKLTGNIQNAYLHVVADSPVGMYIALNDNGINEAFGSRLKYLQSEWKGLCVRAIAKSEASFNVDFSGVNTVKGDDGCETGMETFDLTGLVNLSGIYVGFMTADGSPARVTLTYEGNLKMEAY